MLFHLPVDLYVSKRLKLSLFAEQICLVDISQSRDLAGRRARVVATFINSKPHDFTSFLCRAAAPKHVGVTMVWLAPFPYAFVCMLSRSAQQPWLNH
jgi:hypothetical protein